MIFRKISLDLSVAIFITTLFSSCTTTETLIPYGVQKGYESYIPARISVLSTQDWPATARYKGQLSSNISEEDHKELISNLDKNIISSFSDQPFMKGYTPKLVDKLLVAAEKTDILAKLPRLWSVDLSQCEACVGAGNTYQQKIAENIPWRLWLNDFSKATRYSDALLIPFVIEAFEHRYYDRGLLIAERFAHVALLLVDTNNGNLLWYGARKASVFNQKADISKEHQDSLEYLAWPLVYKRLFHKELWRDFPGRIYEQ